MLEIALKKDDLTPRTFAFMKAYEKLYMLIELMDDTEQALVASLLKVIANQADCTFVQAHDRALADYIEHHRTDGRHGGEAEKAGAAAVEAAARAVVGEDPKP